MFKTETVNFGFKELIPAFNRGKVGKVGTKLNNPKKKNAKGERKISLHYYFDWFEKTFCEKLTDSGSEFLANYVDFKLVGISDEPSPIWNDSDYFVTQVGISKEHSVTIKISDSAANIIFRSALGDRQKETGYLKLKDITELEATILTAFNEFLYKKISGKFLTPKEIHSVENELVTDENTVYLTFYIRGNAFDEAGKILFIFPQFAMRNIIPLGISDNPLNIDYFNACLVEADIIAGNSRITLEDVKNLDVEDIVILEKSSLYSMILKNQENVRINITPDPNIVINIDENNGEEVVSKVTGNIWDSLEVDLSAEFEKVKIRLGDLRSIIEGLVIDVAPIAQNKISLNVEGKQIAAGELVIVGDKYGVKVTQVYNDAKPVKSEPVLAAVSKPEEMSQFNESYEDAGVGLKTDDKYQENDEVDDSDFDFSDYEIEEDI